MSVIPKTEMETFAISDLHPKMRVAIKPMINAARAFGWISRRQKFRFEPFEGYRTPVRQEYLLTIGKATKAGPWESAHQYGLAVDFACRVVDKNGLGAGWSWPEDAPWPVLKQMARAAGLDIPIERDRGHVQHPLWLQFRTFV